MRGGVRCKCLHRRDNMRSSPKTVKMNACKKKLRTEEQAAICFKRPRNKKPCTFPIDLTKTRLQVQGQKLDVRYTELRYRGMIDCFLKVARQEGVRALYYGIWPAIMRQATYGTIKFGTYYSLKDILLKTYHKETVGINVVCATIAGAISSALANPTDVIKVRMQVGGKPCNVGLAACFRDVYVQEGVAGLWKGVLPTAQRAAVIAAVELPVYDFCKSHLLNTFGDKIANHLISSVTASLGSAVASTPLDVIRTRLMNQRKIKTESSIHIYKGTIDCFMKTLNNEGFWALYKGFIPTWLRMGPWNVIFFVTYEQLMQFY